MPSNRPRLADVLPITTVFAFLAFDAAMPFAIARKPNELAVLMGSEGVVIAQTWLLAVWAALGSVSWVRRVSVSLMISVMGMGLFENGLIYIVTWGFTPGIRQVFLAPIELLALMFPLLVLRVWRGWRLVSDQRAVADVQWFSLRQLFAATALVAAAVFFGQFSVTELASEFQQSMLISICLTSAILSLVVVVPLSWLCLRLRLRRAVAWLFVLATTTNGVAITLMCRYWSGRQLKEGFAALVYCDAAVLTFAGILLLLRCIGSIALVSARSADGVADCRITGPGAP